MGHNTITTSRSGAVLTATIDDGEINLLHWRLLSDLNDLLDSIQDDTDLKVLIFASSNPDFFIAHLELVPSAGALFTVLKSVGLMDEKYNLNPILEAALAVSRRIFPSQWILIVLSF
jgi:enoyl-CoA hydratase/carnithine racemase